MLHNVLESIVCHEPSYLIHWGQDKYPLFYRRQIQLHFIQCKPKCPINNRSILVPIMAWRRLGYIRVSASTSSSLPRHGKAWLSHLLHVSLSQVALTANHGLYFFHKFNAYPHSIIRYNIHTEHVMLFWKNRKQNYYRQLFAKCHTKYKPLSVVVLAMRSIQGPYLLNPTTNHHQIAHSLESAIYGSRVIHSPRNLTSLSAAPNAINFKTMR